ncbi:pilus assembly protein TadG [Bradyrhizobium lablabi]|uniref:Pilus assembly protein TadG n=1 Tax=Bradyrhizobium lablabi TaxID=722472 RepID=A0A0R3N189_9BRAD|nr:pilus assembly protein TadG-related protein [Bradyrhizobium lablabi]KRR25710.1 pilus assembly protein TadG [Bradyrhizobium lablabi]
MRNLLRSRRGSAAFATVIALVPLIGVVALGAEAGSWYVTRQHAQNAADSAAYSGALQLACSIAGVCNTSLVAASGKQFAAQNAFCNLGDTSYPGSNCVSLPSGISQAVQIDIGDYAGAFTTPAAGSGNAVRARVSQQQPAYLAAVLGLTTVNIPAQAIAVVQQPSKVCALALGPDPNAGGGALKIAGNVSNNGTGCPIMSDASVQFASTATFNGSGWAVLGATGCSPAGTCANPGVTHNYFMPYAYNPLSKLDSQSFNSRTGPSTKPCGGNVTNGVTCALSPNSAGGVYSDLKVNGGGTLDFAPGTYFFYKATITFAGNVKCTACTPWPPAGTGLGVTLILLGDSSMSIAAGATVDLSAPSTNTFSSDLNGVLIDDQAPNKSSNQVTINGGTVKLGGAMYFPHVDVTFNGSTQSANTTCSQVIAKTLTMGGGGFLSTDGCNPATVPYTQVVVLVQ